MHRYNLRSKVPHLLRLPSDFLKNVCRHVNLVDLYAFSLTCKNLSGLVSEMKIEVKEVHVHFDKREIEFTVYKGRERLKIKMFNYFKDPKVAPHPHPSDRQLTVFHNTGETSAPTVCWKMDGFGFQFFLRRLKSVNQAPVINIAFTHLQKTEYRRIMNALLEFRLGTVTLCFASLQEIEIYLERKYNCFQTAIDIHYNYKQMLMSRLRKNRTTDIQSKKNNSLKEIETVFTLIMNQSYDMEIASFGAAEVNQFLLFWRREGRPTSERFNFLCFSEYRHEEEWVLRDIEYGRTSRAYIQYIDEHPCNTVVIGFDFLNNRRDQAIGFDFSLDNETKATLWFAKNCGKICYIVEFW